MEFEGQDNKCINNVITLTNSGWYGRQVITRVDLMLCAMFLYEPC